MGYARDYQGADRHSIVGRIRLHRCFLWFISSAAKLPCWIPLTHCATNRSGEVMREYLATPIAFARAGSFMDQMSERNYIQLDSSRGAARPEVTLYQNLDDGAWLREPADTVHRGMLLHL
jgi:hypothetical protein